MPGFIHSSLELAKTAYRRATNFIVPGGYAAVKDSNRRRPGPVITMGEDKILPEHDRRKLIAGVSGLRRNFSVAGWMVRRHMDFVSSFRFRAKTGDAAIDKQLERLVARASRPDRAHNKRRLGLMQMLRMAEGLRTTGGDVGWLRLIDRSVQLVESDRIRNPSGAGIERAEWFNGVRVNADGMPLAYSVYQRTNGGSGFQFERIIPASKMWLHGYIDREDQVRGVSPLASAYNELQDVYEFHGLTLARAKVQSFFALAFYRDASESVFDITDDEMDEDGQPKRSGYEADLGKGPAVFDLDPGDKAGFLESGHPSMQLQDYVNGVLILALKSLDLPMSFLDESWTNFFGSKGAWLLYDRACEPKRAENQQLLDDWTYWQLVHWIIDGEFTLPEGVTIDDIPWEWIPRKVPVFRRIEDVKADILALEAGLTTPEGICREEDEGSFADNIQEIAIALGQAKEQGVKVVWDLADNPDLPDDKDSADAADNPRQKQGTNK